MKAEIEISDDLVYENEPPQFCVSYVKVYPYYDDHNYKCERKDDPDILRSGTIEELYEQMGKMVVDHLLYGEVQNKGSYLYCPLEGFEIVFSNIYVEVQEYSVDKMKASKAYQEIGLAREIQKKKEEQARKAEEERHRKWNEEQKEKRDREEFERLSRKFGKK